MKIAPHPTVALKPDKFILKKDFVTVTNNEAENWLYVLWSGERTQETLLSGAELLLECVRTTGANKIINDSSDSKNAWPNLIDHFALHFAPRMQEAGVQYFAWIYDDKNVTKHSADAILQKETSDILVMVFDNVRNAEIWLRAVR